MLRIALALLTCFIVTVSCTSIALEKNTPSQHEIAFRKWTESFAQDARNANINEKTLQAFLTHVEFLPRVIELDRKQPDSTKTFLQYLDLVIPKSRLQKAQQKYNENRALLEKVGNHYGVQPRFIVALWGIESDFGQNMGSFDVLNSLATLAYEGRRADFFKSELIHALKIVQDGHIIREKMKGSWAGAMGQTQFMPSSFTELAQDYNHDKKRDIWTDKEDVFASIANYLSKRGWDKEMSWGREVKLPKNFNHKLLGKEIEKTLKEWQNLGVRRTDGTALPVKNGLKASLIVPNIQDKKAYLVYSNYKVILNWNRSLYFATAVGLLADSIH